MGKATQDLRNEHDAILHVLTIVNKMLSTDTKGEAEVFKFGNELVYFLRIFADKCHHGKEEDYLFKALEARGVPSQGGPIGIMLQEHVQGRAYISSMSSALESQNLTDFKTNAAHYRDLLQAHIANENNVLFAMADRLIDEANQDRLFEKFEAHEENVIGHGVHEELHAMIHKWEEEFSG